MILVTRCSLIRAQAERIRGGGAVTGAKIWVGNQKVGVREVVIDVGRGAGGGGEGCSTCVGGVGIGAEVVVEGDVFAEDDDDVLNCGGGSGGRRGGGRRRGVAISITGRRADYALAAAAEDEGQGHREGEKFPNHF